MKLRSVGAVLAGLLVIVIASTAVDLVLHATGVYPPWGQPMSDALFALATAYRIVISIFGCWLAARLAPNRPWYPLVLVAVAMPCPWLGGRWTRSA